MLKLTHLIAAAAIALGLAAAGPAAALAYYTLNGYVLPAHMQQYLWSIGLPPGHYWLDSQGYWGAIGYAQPLGNIYGGTHLSRYGSGEQGPNGWSHYDALTGFGLAMTPDGCVYADGWSNC